MRALAAAFLAGLLLAGCQTPAPNGGQDHDQANTPRFSGLWRANNPEVPGKVEFRSDGVFRLADFRATRPGADVPPEMAARELEDPYLSYANTMLLAAQRPVANETRARTVDLGRLQPDFANTLRRVVFPLDHDSRLTMYLPEGVRQAYLRILQN